MNNNNYFIKYGVIKKIKKIGKIYFFSFCFKNKILEIILKNCVLNLKNKIVGIYGYYNNLKIFIFEICFYNFKVNNYCLNFIKFRNKLLNYIRNYFYFLKYLELDSPIISEYSKLGSKQFLIIDKNHKKNFFALSQSPQNIKQYYMFNNINKYFQIVKCFRNEDDRSNRLNEFFQIDIENSFTYFKTFKKIISFLIKTMFYYFLKINISFMLIKYKNIKRFLFEKKKLNFPYIFKKLKVRNKYLYIIKSIYVNLTKNDFFFLNFKKYNIIISNNIKDYNIVLKFKFYLKKKNLINLKFILLWIINFPFFVKNKVKHHVFCSLKNNFKKIKNSKSLSYDIYINGLEIGGGGIRNINFYIQKKIFFLSNIKKSRFINFYKTSIPQHCGIALGFERILSLLCIFNIKKTIMYKKNFFVFSKKINENQYNK